MTMPFKLRSGVLAQRVGTDTLLMDANGGQYFELNASGGAMLELLLQGHSPQDIGVKIAEQFTVAREHAERDCTQLIADLQHAQLLTLAA
jgi:hypothetical protein